MHTWPPEKHDEAIPVNEIPLRPVDLRTLQNREPTIRVSRNCQSVVT